MPTVLHPTQRGGGITVRSARYPVDGEGRIEVNDPEHLSILQTIGCKLVGGSPPTPAPSPTRTVSPEPPGLDELSKDDLLEMAEGMGLEVDRRMSKLKLKAAIEAAQGE